MYTYAHDYTILCTHIYIYIYIYIYELQRLRRCPRHMKSCKSHEPALLSRGVRRSSSEKGLQLLQMPPPMVGSRPNVFEKSRRFRRGSGSGPLATQPRLAGSRLRARSLFYTLHCVYTNRLFE